MVDIFKRNYSCKQSAPRLRPSPRPGRVREREPAGGERGGRDDAVHGGARLPPQHDPAQPRAQRARQPPVLTPNRFLSNKIL